MSDRGARRSAPPKTTTIERQARAEAARAQRLGARASNIESASPSERALTIREKIARWLEEKL